MRLFQASGQLGRPCGVGAAAAGRVPRPAGGALPPEEDPAGCLPAAAHPAPVHAGGAFLGLFVCNISCVFPMFRDTSACFLPAGDRRDGRLEAGSPEAVPGLLCGKAQLEPASRRQPGQASPGQASTGPVAASGG